MQLDQERDAITPGRHRVLSAFPLHAAACQLWLAQCLGGLPEFSVSKQPWT